MSAVVLWLARLASSYPLSAQIYEAVSVPFEFSVLAVAPLPVPLVTVPNSLPDVSMP